MAQASGARHHRGLTERCYFGFRRRRRDVRQATSCECNACSRIPDLDLKFVVHHGEAIVQKVAGRQELLGSDVIVVHRLLKNEVVERLDIGAYALITQACIDVSAPRTRREKALMEHIGPAYGEALRSGVPTLIAELGAELARREADRGPEPDLAAPKPDGPFARIAPRS